MIITIHNIKKLFNPIDVHFGDFIRRRQEPTEPSVVLAAELVSAATGSGHVCLDLAAPLSFCENAALPALAPLDLPEPEQWRKTLAAHPAVGAPGDIQPLILDGTRLYLYRYWRYEQQLAAAFRQRAESVQSGVDKTVFRRALQGMFPESIKGGLKEQALAAATAAFKPLCVISGGPGTGKTTAAARIAALLLTLFGADRFRIRMAAPTGKAAARLRESMEAAAAVLDCTDSVKRALPTDAVTLHRLLGSIPGTADFRHHRNHPLAADAVIVDEASMVDLALMAKLVEALPERCRLILMGDRHQLASVEAGAVMGDLCGRRLIPGISRSWAHLLAEATGLCPTVEIPRQRDAAGLSDALVLLHRNFRFSAESGIGRFSRRVNRGDGSGALQTASRWPSEDSVCWINAADRSILHQHLEDIMVRAFEGLVRSESPKKALEQARRFKILCAVNRGPLGVDAFNDLAVRSLQRRGLVAKSRGPWYPGRPVLILENDYVLGLFNGDLGVVMPDPVTGGLQVYFSTEAGGLRSVSPVRIPAHQTAFAMTVHKSQGSEFDEVLLVLPEKDAPVLTRELIYTGATRARDKVILCGTEPVIELAASRRIKRNSGLLDALWGDEPDGQEGKR